MANSIAKSSNVRGNVTKLTEQGFQQSRVLEELF